MMKRWSMVAAAGVTLAAAGWAQEKAPAKPAAPAAPAVKPAAPGVNPALPKATQAAQLVRRAEELQATGKLAEAAALLQQAAELTATDAALWDRAGWAHLDAGKAAEALAAFEAARKAAPAGTEPSGGLLISNFALGREAEVLAHAKRLLPADAYALAAPVITRGLAAQPRTPEWSYALGYLYARVLPQSPRGLEPLEAVVKANPRHADAWLLLHELNKQLDRGPQEDAAAVEYLKLSPNTADAFRLRAQRYATLDKHAEALAEYEAGIVKHPLAAELYYQLARTHERLGGMKQAEDVYRRLVTNAAAQKMDALHTQARAQLANFHARRQNYVEAEKFYREAARNPDATAATWSNWAAMLALSGKWEEAAKAMETTAQRDEQARGKTVPEVRDDLLVARYRAGVCRLAAGQRDLAETNFKAALALKKESRTGPELETRAFLAWLEGRTAKLDQLAYTRSDERWAGFIWRAQPEEGEFEVRGRFAPSAAAWRVILQTAQKRYPDCWPADYALARLYASAGFTTEALALLTRATQARPDWWAPYYAMGQQYARTRNKELGVPVLRKALQLAPQARQARVMLSLLANAREAVPEEEKPDAPEER